MMTVINETTIRPGGEAQWDQAFQERAAEAQKQPGWVSLQLLTPVDEPQKRIVVGTWRDQESWEQWHNTETFQNTRQKLDEVTEHHGEDKWFNVKVEENALQA